MNKTKIATLALCIAFGFSAHAQNLLLNGSFDSPTEPANTFSIAVPDSWVGSGDIRILNGDYSPGYPLPHSGQQYGMVGAASALSQTFTVSVAGRYAVTWFDSTEFNGPDQTSPYTVIVLDAGANTIATTSLDANASSLRLWTQHSIEMTLSPSDRKAFDESLAHVKDLVQAMDRVLGAA